MRFARSFRSVCASACIVFAAGGAPFRAGAQDAGGAAEAAGGAAAEAEAAPEAPPLSAGERAALKEREDAERVLDMDLRTSTLGELAAWCRELGLSEGGVKSELLARLRAHYKLAEPPAGAEAQKVIVIEKAAATEYFTLEAVDEEYARLTGGVSISLKDGDSTHKISAWEILYNRTRNIVTATGNVTYVHEQSDTLETFEGDTITVNLDTWVGSFMDTVSERSISGDATAYRFAGQVISQTEAETTVLKKARITNAARGESFWSLEASRLWLLPGSDWALVNAVLKVGEIPVLWLPGFFFPSDEALFHPVLGNRAREGNYVQTSTYIWGRPEPDPSKENSISKILGSGADMEKKREGVFLRNLQRKRRNPDSKVLAILLDGYANLGFYTGVKAQVPAAGPLNNFKLDTGLAWTRTVHNYNGYYTPFDSYDSSGTGSSGKDFSGESDWNHANLFGVEVPFRYRNKLSFNFSTPVGSASMDLPLYSDPFIDQDMLNRQEMMDWMKMLKSGQIATEEDNKKYALSSYQWTLSISPRLSTTFFAPYVSTLSVNSLQTYLSFNYKNDKNIPPTSPSPSRQFYYPDKWTMYSASGSIGGTPLSFSTAGSPKEKDKERENPLEGIGTPVSPWPAPPEEKPAEAGSVDGTGPLDMNPPALAQTFTLPRMSALQASWTYRFDPSSAGEWQFNPSKWNTERDINWSDTASHFFNFKTNGSTTITISEANNGVFSLSGTLSGNAAWQDHTYVNTESDLYKPASGDTGSENSNLANMRRADNSATYWTSAYAANATVKPFYWSDIFAASTLQYNMGGLFAKSKLEQNTATKVEDEVRPEWTVVWGKWEREDLSAHSVGANISANVMEKTQTLSFQASLPPLYKNFSASAAARAWITETTAGASLRETTEAEDKAQEQAQASAAANNQRPPQKTHGTIWPGWAFGALNLGETLTFGASRNLRQTLAYDPELGEWTSANTAFAWGSLSVSFAAARMYKYEFEAGRGWVQRSDWQKGDTPELRPRDLSANYALNLAQRSYFDNLIKLTVSGRAALSFDLQRYTYSRFSASLSATVGIAKFIDFTLSANTENANIYRYMQDLPFFSDLRDKQEVPGEKNVFIDLLNSFRFDDEQRRRSSGFKFKSFSFSATHYLGDWNAVFSVNSSPSLEGTPGNQQYRFITNVSFLVQWIPLSEIKAEIYYDGKTEKFIRKE